MWGAAGVRRCHSIELKVSPITPLKHGAKPRSGSVPCAPLARILSRCFLIEAVFGRVEGGFFITWVKLHFKVFLFPVSYFNHSHAAVVFKCASALPEGGVQSWREHISLHPKESRSGLATTGTMRDVLKGVALYSRRVIIAANHYKIKKR